MTPQLTDTEINAAQQLLEGNSDAQKALAILKKHNGRLDISFDELWEEKTGISNYGKKSLWQVTLGELRKELCGDEGFRGKMKDYTNNPGSAPLLTGLIVSLVGIAGAHGLPLDPAIATIIVLYIVKIGLNIYCEYTEPAANPNLPAGEEEKGK